MEKINQLRVEMPQAGYIRQALLIPGILPISPATLWRWVAMGKFPKPVKFGARVTAWRVEDVARWLRAQ
jgi:prophage regulatory protein